MVEGQGHGLERWQMVQSSHGDLGQGVIVQPQVTQGQQPLKAPVGHHGDEVGIQAAVGGQKQAGISASPARRVVQGERCVDGQGDRTGL